jgi:hypothetical protein
MSERVFALPERRKAVLTSEHDETLRVVTRYHLLALLILACWGMTSPSQSIGPDARVAGTWDGYFSGLVEGAGTSQTDAFVMKLEQDGSSVKGTIRFEGLDLSFPVSGKVMATTFSYTAKGDIGENCKFTLAGETVVNGNRMKGSQTQTNCEGTAKGEVTAVRR